MRKTIYLWIFPIWKTILPNFMTFYGIFALIRDDFLPDRWQNKLKLIGFFNMIPWYLWVIAGLLLYFVLKTKQIHKALNTKDNHDNKFKDSELNKINDDKNKSPQLEQIYKSFDTVVNEFRTAYRSSFLSKGDYSHLQGGVDPTVGHNCKNSIIEISDFVNDFIKTEYHSLPNFKQKPISSAVESISKLIEILKDHYNKIPDTGSLPDSLELCIGTLKKEMLYGKGV